jgi:glycosyltransferase involved in cell wall biosynthesis
VHTTPPTVCQTPVKVSVVVPTHNTGETVLTGLRSFLDQSLPGSDFEVVYVDDGSTDDTLSILESELADRDAGSGPAVRLIRIPNSGWPGKPRNVGMDAARGEFVHFVDDDDWLAPEALERTYERALETGADIVIGRMAGHGRSAPRALFEKPLAAADLRSDTALLASMTVHKLFRRSFLERHRLRFAEGRVRLEDHMFTLRAFLLTGRVATVHDYTCYHWVRHRGEDHNISYETIEPGPYMDSVRKVLAILDAPDTYVAPGRHRRRLTANWYGKKALARISGQLLLRHSGPRRAEWFDAVSELAADVPPSTDAALPTRLRVVAALARNGDLASLEEHAEFEAGVDHRPLVHSVERHEGGRRLTVRCGTRLVRRKGKGAPAVPLAFSRSTGRYLLRLAPGVAEVPGAAEAADFTKAVERSNVRCLLRHRGGGTVLSVPLEHRVVEVPVREGRGAAKLLAGAARRMGMPDRSTSRTPGGGREDEVCGLAFETEFTVDLSSADNGSAPAPGVWDLQLQLGCGGWRFARTLHGCSIEVPADEPAAGRKDASTRRRPSRRRPAPLRPVAAR